MVEIALWLICYVLCGLCVGYALGDSLSFVLTVYSFGFRYHRFGNEEFGLIVVHTLMISAMNDFEMTSDKCFT